MKLVVINQNAQEKADHRHALIPRVPSMFPSIPAAINYATVGLVYVAQVKRTFNARSRMHLNPTSRST